MSARKSILIQTEKAIQAYLVSAKVDTNLEICTIYVGHSAKATIQITPPDIILAASDVAPFGVEANIYELKLKAIIETQVDDEPTDDDEDTHHDRVAVLRDLLENFDALFAAVNHPASPANDPRSVTNFTLSCLNFEDEMQTQADRRLITMLTYYVAASPVDEVGVEA